MLAWMIYAIVVSLLLGLAALAFERSAHLRLRPTRWLWGASIIASLLFPLAISSISFQIPTLAGIAPSAAAQKIIALHQMTTAAFSPSTWLLASTGTVAASLDTLLERAWLVASVSLFLLLCVSGAHLFWRERRWERGMMAAFPVLIAEDAGPALVGLLRPHIVVPRWLVTATPDEQELVIAHERSHLEAGDAQLLTIAVFLLICMPWNLPLWWQLRRLRRSIEMDCDARVLKHGHNISRYGEVLIAVGERQSTTIAVVAAMSESKTFLEQRIRNMLRKRTKFSWASGAALACLGIALAAGAAEVSPPSADKPAQQEVTVDSKVLEGYVGFYQLSESAILTVTLNGQQLTAQLTGQPAVPLYAHSNTEFFLKVVDAQIRFLPDAQGQAAALILRQGGRNATMQRIDANTAQQIADKAAEKLKSQAQNPATEAALRRYVTGIINGKPNYDEMSPALADATRQQLPKVQAWLVSMGAVQSFQFLGADAQGDDVYTVRQDKGPTHWLIGVDTHGTIYTAMVSAGP